MPDVKERKMATTTAPAKTGAGSGAGEDEAAAKKKKKLTPLKLVAIVVIATLLAVGGGAYAFWYLTIRVPPPEPPPEPGAVSVWGPISLNLADGHYLKVGIAVQMALEAAGGHGGAAEIDGSKALDLTIETFSGRTIDELSDAKTRDELKKELEHDIEKAYEEEHHTVLDLYFTEFVMQ